jgi:predicted glutamine amidotransferase
MSANTHPFTGDGLAFAHNGSVPVDGPLEQLLSPARAAALTGTTDSERYFAVVRRHLRKAPDLPTATLAAVRELRALYPLASLNALLLDGTSLVAVHASARSALPPEDTELCREAGLPQDHLDDYFALRIRHTAEGVQIGSTGFGQAGWEPLPADCITTIGLADLSVTVEPLDIAAATSLCLSSLARMSPWT